MLNKTALTAARPAGTRGHGVTRTEYHNARKLLSDNGRYALRWMPDRVRQVMARMWDAPVDQLREKAEFLARPDCVTWQGACWWKQEKPRAEFLAMNARSKFFAHAAREALARINRR
jgi:hypothetical protein